MDRYLLHNELVQEGYILRLKTLPLDIQENCWKVIRAMVMDGEQKASARMNKLTKRLKVDIVA